MTDIIPSFLTSGEERNEGRNEDTNEELTEQAVLITR